ncbi:hypothetical protein HDZ31DRAFT_35267 [Schizophyllum fasciatum]
MRFSTFVVALSTASVALAQEAARFGLLTVDGKTDVSVGETLSLTYDSSAAQYVPQTVDFVLQGTRKNGNLTPYVVLSREDVSADQKVVHKEFQVPDVIAAYGNDVASWQATAFITYEYNDYNPPIVQSGGTTAAFNIV